MRFFQSRNVLNGLEQCLLVGSLNDFVQGFGLRERKELFQSQTEEICNLHSFHIPFRFAAHLQVLVLVLRPLKKEVRKRGLTEASSYKREAQETHHKYTQFVQAIGTLL